MKIKKKKNRGIKLEKSLVCITATSNKFWKIKVQGNMFIVSYGKIGTQGSINTKEFASKELCWKEANRLIESKLKKGYRESGEQEGQVGVMTENQFWDLVDTAHKKGGDMEEQLEWLVGKLAKKSVIDIIKFDTHFNRNYVKSYTSDLWAAAWIILGGCSDDSFDYFRAWLLFLGKGAYEEAIRNPESIIPNLEKLDGDVPEFEAFLYAACEAFEEKTGQDLDNYLEMYSQLSGDEQEQPDLELEWDEGDEKGLQKMFPRFWELYGEDPLG